MREKSSIWLDELRRERLQSSSRNPGIAALMSFFVMGLGQIYAGHVDRGIMLLGIHISSIVSAISLYNKGLVYETIGPVLGTNALVLICYCFCVVYILLWIYNIKDAYYLSLFSSFRDWFEVERVLLPMLQGQTENLLGAPEHNSERLIETAQQKETSSAGLVDEVVNARAQTESVPIDSTEDVDVIEVAAEKAGSEAAGKISDSASDAGSDADESISEEEPVVFYSDIGSFSFAGQSWKLYTGLVLIFILIGLWFHGKNGQESQTQPVKDETLFSMTADLPDQETIKKAMEGEVVPPPEIKVSPAKPDEIVAVNEEPASVTSPVHTLFVTGIELVSAGKYAEACAEFEKDLLLENPDRATWTIILNSFYRSDNKLAYELKLRKYLESYSDDSSAWFNLGKILYDRQEFPQASQAIIKGLKAEPDNVRGNFLLGSIYWDLKLFEDASVYLRRAVSFEPLNVEFILALAKCLQNSGNYEEAAKYYQRILSLDPSHTEAADAIKQMNRARYSPENMSSDDTSDQIVVIQGKTAARVINKSEEIGPVSTSENLVFDNESEPRTQAVLYDSGKEEGDQGSAIADVPDEMPVTIIEETPALVNNSEQTAEDALQEKLNLSPEKTGKVLFEKKESSSEEPVQQKIEEVKEKEVVKQEKAELKGSDPVVASKKNADKDADESELEAAPKKEENLMNAVAIEANGAEEAIEALRKSAFQEYSRGNWEKSLPLYLEYLKKKKDPKAYDVVSIIFEKIGMHNDAFEACEHAFNSGLQELPTLIRLGKLAEKTSRFKDGENYLRLALEKSPHRVDLRIRFARCLSMNGNKEEAVKQLESLLNKKSSSYAVKSRVESELKLIRKMMN